MQRQYMLGIDLGTSGCKALLIDEQGGIAAEGFSGYGLSVPRPGWIEQDPCNWWEAVKAAVRTMLVGFEPVRNIRGIGLSGQMHGLVLLDAIGKVLRPCILWCDQRNEKQCNDIYRLAGGEEALLRLTNNKMLTGYTGGKILWVMENEPHVYDQARMILNPKDYIRYCLTGTYATEVSDASGTGLFDVKNRKWSSTLLDLLGISGDMVAPCHESMAITGTLSKEAAGELGLPDGIPVAGGGGDAIVQSIGSGLITGGGLGVTIGTGSQVTAALEAFVRNKGGNLQVFCHAIPGKWHAMGVSLTAGSALRWLRDLLYGWEAASDRAQFHQMDEQASAIPAGSEGLFFLPYLEGERCPYNDPSARGCFVGLSLSHGRAHMIRSVLEGVAYAIRDLSEAMSGLEIASGKVCASGGGATSGLWRQIIADVLDQDVYTVNTAAYGGAFGAAIVAGVGVGTWSSFAEAASVIRVVTQSHPMEQNVCQYKRGYEIYRSMYPSLRESFHQINNESRG